MALMTATSTHLTQGYMQQSSQPVRQLGKLRLFLGSAPGVGKTYTMLAEALQRQYQGQSVYVSVIRTHGQSATLALLNQLPRATPCDGDQIEPDVADIVRQRPDLVIIDDASYGQRVRIIQELLQAGINVWSSLNVHEIESLNAVLEPLTGVVSPRTIADAFFDSADEVHLVDLPPDELLARLKGGKIVLCDRAEKNRERYFRRSTLIALRDLALRAMSTRTQRQIRGEALRQGMSNPAGFKTERLMLALDQVHYEAVRELYRMAQTSLSKAALLWMGDIEHDNDQVSQFLRFAEQMGIAVYNFNENTPEAVFNYAKDHGVSSVALLSRSTLADAMWLRKARALAPLVHVMFIGRAKPESPKIARNVTQGRFQWHGYWQSVVYSLVIALVLYPIQNEIWPTSLTLIYLLGVVLVGMHYGAGPAAFMTVLSIFMFDYFIVSPQWSLYIEEPQYLITFAVMLVVGLIVGQLVAKREKLAQLSSLRERHTRWLLEASRKFSLALQADEVYEVLRIVLHRQLGVPAECWSLAHDNALQPVNRRIDNVDAERVAWVYEHHMALQPEEKGANHLWYLPMSAGDQVPAVLVVQWKKARREGSLALGERRLIEALAELAAQALIRIEYGEQARQSVIAMEADRLRYSLVQSLSHDLRTPVTMLKIGAETLTDKLRHGQYEAGLTLSEKLLASTDRMQRLVANLLEMARLQSGTIKLKKTWIPAVELFGEARRELGERLSGNSVKVKVCRNCPPVYGDEVMIVRVLVNFLDNAVKYAGSHADIVCEATCENDRVCLSVADSGEGLPQGDTAALFEPFKRGRPEASVTGAGLGLAIARTIARAHGGEVIPTRSELGGAKFSLWLPFVAMEELDDEETVLSRSENEEQEHVSR